jgi:hypothetical protein
MTRELIITEKCMGLYKDDEGRVQHCQHAMGHVPECGPDTIARPYVEPVAQEAPQAAPVAEAMYAASVLGYVQGRNGDTDRHGRHIQYVHPITAAALFAFAMLMDQGRAHVHEDEIAAILGNAPSSVRRHLREHRTVVEHIGRGWFKPATVVVKAESTPRKPQRDALRDQANARQMADAVWSDLRNDARVADDSPTRGGDIYTEPTELVFHYASRDVRLTRDGFGAVHATITAGPDTGRDWWSTAGAEEAVKAMVRDLYGKPCADGYGTGRDSCPGCDASAEDFEDRYAGRLGAMPANPLA